MSARSPREPATRAKRLADSKTAQVAEQRQRVARGARAARADLSSEARLTDTATEYRRLLEIVPAVVRVKALAFEVIECFSVTYPHLKPQFLAAVNSLNWRWPPGCVIDRLIRWHMEELLQRVVHQVSLVPGTRAEVLTMLCETLKWTALTTEGEDLTEYLFRAWWPQHEQSQGVPYYRVSESLIEASLARHQTALSDPRREFPPKAQR